MLIKYITLDNDNQRILAAIQRFKEGLQETLRFQDLNWPNISYQYFGSLLNGFGMKTSDVDFTLLSNSFIHDTESMQLIYKQLCDAKQTLAYKKIDFARHARVPVIQIVDKDGVEFDLCMNNILGVVNSRLLAAYAHLHPKIQQGGILLKIWGKKYNVINKSHFSSYAIVLMWLCYLQRKHQLPDLQDYKRFSATPPQNAVTKVKRIVNGETEIFDVDFWFVTEKSPLYQKLKNDLKLDAPLEDLLSGFWEYYDHQNPNGILNDKKISIHQVEEQTKDNIFSIVDPYDAKHDPGKKVMNFKDRDIFKRSFEIIRKKNQESYDALFLNKE